MEGRRWQGRLLDAVLANLIALVVANYVAIIGAVTAGLLLDFPPGVYIVLALLLLPFPVYWVARGRQNKNQDFRTHRAIAKLVGLSATDDNLPIVVIGSTYLDLKLFGIEASALRDEEWTGLERVKVSIGGSAFRVARSLCLDYGINPHFFTLRSENPDDRLAALMLDLLKEEPWVSLDTIPSFPECHAPVTVLVTSLVGPRKKTTLVGPRKQTTMFTHPGPLSRLEWELVPNDLLAMSSSPCVLYIGGFFKTNLSAGLAEHLEGFATHGLVIIDHGRLPAEDQSKVAVSRLRAAFRRSLVDVYLCQYLELIQLLGLGRERSSPKSRVRHLRAIGRQYQLALPLLTIVRSEGSVYVIYRGSVTEVRSRNPDLEAELYSNSRFNAGFIKHFCSGFDIRKSLEAHAIDAADAAVVDQAS